MLTQARFTSESTSLNAAHKKEQDWARRRKKIEDEQATEISTPWYLMVWSYCIGMATSIQATFQSIPFIKIFYPDHPGTQEIFTHVGFTILPSIIKFTSPVALGMSWLNAGLAIRRFTKAENKNVWEYGNLFFSCVTPFIWTALFIAGVTISAAVLAPIAPWICVGVLSAFVCKGLFDCVTNCYRAWIAHKEGDKEARDEYLKYAVKNVVGIIFNVLALTTSIIFGIKMAEAGDKLNAAIEYFKQTLNVDKLKAANELISSLFTQGNKLLGALTGFAVIGVLAEHSERIAKMNVETASALLHPIDALTIGFNRFTARPIAQLGNMLIGIIKLPVRAALFLTLGPLQLLMLGVKNLYNFLTRSEHSTSPKSTVHVDEAAEVKALNDEEEKMHTKAKTKIATYDRLIREIYKNDFSQVPDEMKAKRMMHKLIHENKTESVDAIIARVKGNVPTGKGGEFDFKGSGVFNSMFKRKSETKQFTEIACALEKRRHKVI